MNKQEKRKNDILVVDDRLDNVTLRTMKARYRYRIYPTQEQRTALAQLFGCVRVVWNNALSFCIEQYKKGEKKPKNGELQKQLITQAKKTKEKEWLGEVSAIPLQQSLNDLNQAYSNFFKSCKGKRKGQKIKPPRFKKRKSRQSARFTRGGFKVSQHNVYLAKIGKVKIVWSRELPSTPSSVTVIKDSANRYFLSFVVEIIPSPLTPLSKGGTKGGIKSCGIDLGITTFATFSNGEKVKAPKPLKKNLKRLRKLQRQLSRQQKGSKRREVARKKVAKLHAKIKDTRTDFLHKLSTRVIRENQSIAVEDLNVSGMMKNRKLSRAISDLGWREFRTMLGNKSDKYGRNFKVISRWEPTSQTCSSCRQKGGKLAVRPRVAEGRKGTRTKIDLSIRDWTCLWCGETHDRDENAAINIEVAGGHPETINAHGGTGKTVAKTAPSDEVRTAPEWIQLDLFGESPSL